MKALLLGVLSALVLASIPAAEVSAHGRYYRGHSRVSVGFGYGHYRPFGYYYPSSYVGVSVWPRVSRHRHRSDGQRNQTRMKQLFVYPAASQTSEQLANDRYDCHVWSVEQSDYDPTVATGNLEQADAYARAFSACMEARDYVVK